jgi:hypothetical protein
MALMRHTWGGPWSVLDGATVSVISFVDAHPGGSGVVEPVRSTTWPAVSRSVILKVTLLEVRRTTAALSIAIRSP